MTTIMPQSELTRKAIAWICEKQGEEKGRALNDWIDEAAVRFNLSPKDMEFLQRFYSDKKDCIAE